MSDAGLASPDSRFAVDFNRAAFVFRHDLHRRPLYDLESLVALARRLGPHNATWSTRPATLGTGWADRVARERSLEAAMADMVRSDALVVLRGIEADPVFGAVFGPAVADLAAQSRLGPANGMLRGSATLYVSAPRRGGGIQINAVPAFRLQVRGAVTFNTFDRPVMTQYDLEAFHAAPQHALPYAPKRQYRSVATAFMPGNGMHLPMEWPYWTQNGPDISVCVSIGYQLHVTDRHARLHRANHALRRVGLSPSPPGRAGWRDGCKLALLAGWDRLRPGPA